MEHTAEIAVMTFTYFLVNMLQFVFGSILDKVAGSFGRAVVGLAAGVCTVCGTAIIADAVAPQERGRALYTLALGASVALIVGMPASRLLTAFFDWRTIFGGIAALLLVAFVAAARILPSTAGKPAAPLRKRLSYLANRQVLAVMTSCVVMFISYSMIFTYVAPYLASVSNSLEATIGWVLMGMGIASLVGSKLGGHLVGRIGALRTLVMGTALQALILGLAFLFRKSGVPTLVALVAWILAAWLTGPTFNLSLIGAAPEASGILLSLNTSAMQLGFALGAGLGGVAISLWSVQSLTWLGALIVALASLIGVSAARSALPQASRAAA